MSRIDYDERTAAAYRSARELSREGLADWRAKILEHLAPQAVPAGTGHLPVLDVGAGTGSFSTALADWLERDVIAVEPAPAMRALIPRHPRVTVLAARAEDLPLAADSAGGAFLSTVTQHFTDLPAAAAQLRRVLAADCPVLIRNVFAGRTSGLAMARFFPESRRVVDTFPSVAQTAAAFEQAGFVVESFTAVPQVTVTSLTQFAARIDRAADTLLRGLTDEEFERGMARLRAAAAAEKNQGQPVISRLDLLVMR